MSAEALGAVVHAQRWRAVASVTRLVGDLDVAEEAVQDACVAAMWQWERDGVPRNPSSWLIGAAHHKAIDRLRREARRTQKEVAATREGSAEQAPDDASEERIGDDQLALIFTCCHPALHPSVRVPLTLRSVCGLSTGQIASVLLLPEPTVAQRIVRAKRKIRDTRITFRVPAPESLAARLTDVLSVVCVVFTAGHRASRGPELVSGELCDEAIRLARVLTRLIPEEPEAAGLLALMLLTDARRGTRTDHAGQLILLADQERDLWDEGKIREGVGLIERALFMRSPGPYQLQAAIAACHATAATVADTDWREIAALYGELQRHQPTPVVSANRAVAVAMAHGPAAGLAILDRIPDQQLLRWPPFYIARAELLHRLGRTSEAVAAYQTALDLELPTAEHTHILARIAELTTVGSAVSGASSPGPNQIKTDDSRR